MILLPLKMNKWILKGSRNSSNNMLCWDLLHVWEIAYKVDFKFSVILTFQSISKILYMILFIYTFCHMAIPVTSYTPGLVINHCSSPCFKWNSCYLKQERKLMEVITFSTGLHIYLSNNPHLFACNFLDNGVQATVNFRLGQRYNLRAELTSFSIH